MHPLNDVLEKLDPDRLTAGQLATIMAFPRLQEFLTFTAAVRTIRDKRLWRGEFKSFDDYCRSRFGFSEQATRFIFALQDQANNLVN